MSSKVLTDKEIVHRLEALRAKQGQGDLGDRDVAHLQRHQRYELKEVPLEDIQIQGPSPASPPTLAFHEPQDEDPPIVLDGIWMVPWAGQSQLAAARERGDTHVLAYVGLHPRLDRTFIPAPDQREAWESARVLHSHFLTMIAWRTPRASDPANRVPGLPDLLELAEKASLEFMDEEGRSLLGAAVEAWQQTAYKDLARPLLGCLLRRGASPDRTTKMTLSPDEAHTPFHWALQEFHPSPVVLDPESPLPAYVWEMFRPHLDLVLPKNQAFVGSWLERAGNRPLKGVAEEIQVSLAQADLKARLPDPAPSRPSTRL